MMKITTDFMGMMRVYYPEVPKDNYEGELQQYFEKFWELCKDFPKVFTNEVFTKIFPDLEMKWDYNQLIKKSFTFRIVIAGYKDTPVMDYFLEFHKQIRTIKRKFLKIYKCTHKQNNFPLIAILEDILEEFIPDEKDDDFSDDSSTTCSSVDTARVDELCEETLKDWEERHHNPYRRFFSFVGNYKF
jgi:hypothetical protein